MNLPVSNELIDLGSVVVLVFIVGGALYKVRGGSLHHFNRWSLKATNGIAQSTTPLKTTLNAFLTVLFRDVFATRVLDNCNRIKRIAHLALFWGFVFLGVSTTLAFITNPTDVILPLTDPVKLFGNAGGILVVAGFVSMFYVRYREKAPIWRLTRSDVFMVTLFLTVITGFVTQEAIYSTSGSGWVSGTFWLHMVFVTTLLATAPFTKFFHAISKPVSIFREEVDGRTGKEPVLPIETYHMEGESG
ncbi:MAG: hypothetical protein JRN12_02695 [Nitrososphaerota archaeon]|jgi:nitrate reductase gamma subunit|nr:hypothetical protein [Nitrososphaerota archaeon]MDG6943018.1 hypothetical protein [Nitrososphaerota archaeon]MDG6950747.1 hypothetical protein [Nitrososphaerota archaeon]